ncbi:MAG: hypothetical protein JXA81_14185 [Sedimentisphaerales bacterium]|nr:hypothetical protein [Sedimentisphaerales bacterium]
MKIALQKNFIKRSFDIACGQQFWGIVSIEQQPNDIRSLLMTELHDRTDIEWIAGANWCLVFEKGSANDYSLSHSNESRLHVAVCGQVWPLNDKNEKNSQLVVGLYKLYGDRVINQCDGQFAAVIVDENNARTVLTVNWPGGFHRLYYCTDGHSLAFANRLELLVHRCGWRAQVNEQAVVDLLRFGGLVTEVSLLEGVNRVIPGFAVVFEKGRIIRHLVYEYPFCENHNPLDTTEAACLHREAIQKRISGHSDFGLFLSGGLDSGMNVAVAAELSSKPIRTFNVGFDSNEFDESEYARLVAKNYNTEHHELRLDTTACLDRLPEMVWAMQEPISDYSYVPTFYVAEAIKKHVDLAIGGDGPDHFLGRNYQYATWYDLLRRIPIALNVADWCVRVNDDKTKIRSGFWKYVRKTRLGRQLWQSLACATAPCGSGLLNSFCNVLWGDLPPNDLSKLLSSDLLRRTSVAAYNHTWIDRWRQLQASNSQNSFILADASLSGMCGVFAKVGAMCSAHNLIIHEPYLAAPLFRYFYGLKDSWRVDGSWLKRLTRTVPNSETKRILREAAASYLPEEIILQKQKHGFELPLVKCWQQSTSGISARNIFGVLLDNTDWFDHEYLDRLVQEQASGVRNHRYLLLLLAALDQWFKIFIQGDSKPPTWKWTDSF